MPKCLRDFVQWHLEEHAAEVRAAARSSDPDTSHEAAASLPPIVLRWLWECVLTLFYLRGPMRDEILTKLYRGFYDLNLPPASSTVRSRRRELVKLGLIRKTGAKQKMSGSKRKRGSIVWGFTQLVLDVIQAHYEEGHHDEE